MKSPVPYFGGKQRLASWIVSLLPEHDHYVEPFAGSLSVLLAKQPSRMETVNDLDGELMTFWRVLRDQPEQLIRACMLTPHSRAEQAEDAIERVRQLCELTITASVRVQARQQALDTLAALDEPQQPTSGIYAPDPDCETGDVRTCTTACTVHGEPAEQQPAA
ncbi:DNA adenine methylase [Streptomyces sp. NPDC008061]|uniref:DNA adenine methylase n=1 Tax=Streptomyces sp. NPDC008061 TaxID=3364805 RepID=UPI0036EB8925